MIISRKIRRLVGFWMPRPLPIGAAERHDRGRAGIDQLARVDHVVVGVGQDDEAFLDQDACGFQQSGIVGEQRLLVADDFQLDPVGQADFAASRAPCGSRRRRCSRRPYWAE